MWDKVWCLSTSKTESYVDALKIFKYLKVILNVWALF